MKLKSIELKGFKSFQNKTKIVFPVDGLVSIVGPNGSGKSNVLDAFRWVLGEQNAKTLRGEKMEDVIFSGTQFKKPLNMCEVEIVFDNSSHTLDLDYDEVSIRRKAYRTGESSFYINNKSCRLKDIRELFMNSGIGREGYSIVGQGKVDEIVNANSQDRRKIFEEACGITKYRYKKEENERKLSRVKENLERIEDVYAEIERRVLPLEKEKEKAEQYFLLKKELKVSELNLILKETEGIVEQIQTDEEELHQREQERLSKESQLENLQEQKEEHDNFRKEQKQLQERMQQQLIEKSEQQQTLTYNIQKNDELVKSIHTQETYLKNELISLENDVIRLKEDRHKQELLLQQKQGEEKEKQQQLEEMTSKEGEVVSYFKELEERIKEEQKLFFDKTSQKNVLLSKKEQLEVQQKESKTEGTEHESRKTELEAERFKVVQEVEKSRLALERANEEQLTLERDFRELRQKMESYKKQLDSLTGEYNAFQVEVNTLDSKRKMLENMQKEYEGMPHAIKPLMKDFKLDGIYDVVANLIDTDKKYETAIESALGGAIYHIVVEDSFVAKKAIQFLKTNKLGRVTMLPIQNMKAKYPHSAAKHETFANQVVRVNPKYQTVIDSLLGRTILCETIDQAIETSKKYDYQYKIVTLEGDIFNAGGSVTGGYRSKKVNWLANKRLQKEQETLFLQKQQQLSDLQKKREQLLKEEKESWQHQQALWNQLEEKKKQKEELQFQTHQLDQKEMELERRIQEKIVLLQQLEERQEQRNSQIVSFEEEIAKLEEEQFAHKTLILEKEQEKTGFEQQKQMHGKELETLRLDAISLLRQIEGLQHTIQIQSDNLASVSRQIAERKRQEQENQERVEQLIAEKEQFSLEKKKLEEESIALKQQLVEQQHKGQTKLESEQQLEERIKQLESEQLKEMRASFELEKRLNKNKMIIDHYNEKLEEDYHLEIGQIQAFYDENANTKKTYIQELRRKIDSLGNVNLNAIEEYAEVKERYEFYREQKHDLTEAMETTEKVIRELQYTMSKEFKQEFAEINSCFQHTFRALFGESGTAELVLVNEEDLLQSEIEIKAQPPGKKLKSIAAMSGGEKALTAIGIVFAILMRRPAPFCFLDEIDAPLDDINVHRFNEFLSHLLEETQFVTITHRRGTMKSSKYIYGVTMEEKGISKLLSMELQEAGDFIEE